MLTKVLEQKTSILAEEVEQTYERFKKLSEEIGHCCSARGVLDWDMATMLPESGNDSRAKVIACLSGVAYEKATSSEYARVLQALVTTADNGHLDSTRSAVVRKAARIFERQRKLSSEFVQRRDALCADAHLVWSKAREANDWNAFLPTFEKIIAVKREEAALVGSKESPYDALLDEFEPGMTTRTASEMLGAIVPTLSSLLRRIQTSHTTLVPATFPKIEAVRQKSFNEWIATRLGFDFGAGRLDASAHPFTSRMHPGDVRITTRYREDDLLYGLMSTIHEVGHGLYEQGIPADHYGMSAGEAPSLGIHESQSRLWENIVGRSRSFASFLAEECRTLGFKPDDAQLHASLNNVAPSYIRTEADEVTYNLHITIRFEIERDLIEGKLEAKDVPEMWNQKMREYLGVTPPNAAHGPLQDVHWSAGLIGYFPTYTLGNLYASQLYAAASASIPKLEEGFCAGEFGRLLAWLRMHVHTYGGLKDSAEIVRDATGRAPDPKYFLEYIERKYTELYQL